MNLNLQNFLLIGKTQKPSVSFSRLEEKKKRKEKMLLPIITSCLLHCIDSLLRRTFNQMQETQSCFAEAADRSSVVLQCGDMQRVGATCYSAIVTAASKVIYQSVNRLHAGRETFFSGGDSVMDFTVELRMI